MKIYFRIFTVILMSKLLKVDLNLVEQNITNLLNDSLLTNDNVFSSANSSNHLLNIDDSIQISKQIQKESFFGYLHLNKIK